jgi:hypothetical protein
MRFQGSPFGRKSPPAQEPFDATIDSVALASQQEREIATRNMSLDLSKMGFRLNILGIRVWQAGRLGFRQRR